MKPEEQWQQTATRFRETLPETSPDAPLPGFATRVVALADLDPQTPLLTRFRIWSLGTAAASAVALTILLTLQEPKAQFIPVPELDLPNPAKS